MFWSATTHVSSLAATASRRVRDVGDRATLALEIREPAHALFTSALVQRIGRVLEPRDLRLERSRSRRRRCCARGRTARARGLALCRRAPRPIGRRRECASVPLAGMRFEERAESRRDRTRRARTRSAYVAGARERARRHAGQRAGVAAPIGPLEPRELRARAARASPGAGCDRTSTRTYVKRVVGDVDQIAVARLAEHVAPIVAVGPQLRVLEREVDAPQHRDAEEVAVRRRSTR